MAKTDASLKNAMMSATPLSWPPPGLERLQGRLWRVIGVAWVGSVILVLPLLWALAVEQPFYSLGPFEENWQVGLGFAVVGATVIVIAFGDLFELMRGAAIASDAGYGALTILEVAADRRRDMGFLIQGKRHFGSLDSDRREAIVRSRLRGGALALGGAVWFVVGFGISVLLAARGFLTPSGVWLLTLGPSFLMLAAGLAFLLGQRTTVSSARIGWAAQEGADRVRTESESWTDRLDSAGDLVVLGSGTKGQGGRFRRGAALVAVLFLAAFGPTITIAVTTAIGPILASIAIPSFLSVQEMAGGAEILRRNVVTKNASVTPEAAGSALQNLAFVGGVPDPEEWEQPPRTAYEDPWFPNADFFPDPFSQSVARDLLSRPLADFAEDQQAALRQAAGHPAQDEFELLAQASLVDVVSGRWTLPFADSMTFQDLPWPRFQAFRTAGLARVAKAAVELADGEAETAENTLEELISTGFLLIDQGPTLLDNLMGVVLVNLGGDALEAYYARIGDVREAEALEWGRQGALEAARKARAGLIPEDIRSLLQGVPDIVETDDALRGLRWEYFATFNMLSPCINLHKMVFGPDQTYDEWRERARDALVRVPGERDLFELAESGVLGSGGQDLQGFFPRFLSLALGSGGAPGSCASLIASLQSGG